MKYLAVIAAVAAAFLILSANAIAQSSTDEIVVVATRSPQNLDKIGNSVTVLDEQSIKDSHSTDVSQLLATTPGITFPDFVNPVVFDAERTTYSCGGSPGSYPSSL